MVSTVVGGVMNEPTIGKIVVLLWYSSLNYHNAIYVI